MTKSQSFIRRKLGASGISVAPIGLGCMSLSGVYGASDDTNAIRLIHHALDAGFDFLDSADMYGWGHNEEVVGRAIAGRKDLVLATKFGQVRQEGGANGVNGRPEYVAEACEASLKRLNVDVIDIYFQHRVDPSVPIEDTVGAMSKLVKEGKVRALGLSEAHPDTIRRAHQVHPIAAVQSEYSLLYREDAEKALKTTRELGIAFIAYSPLGRGLLTGQIRDTQFAEGDARGRFPRFAKENLSQNLELVDRIAALAAEKRCTPAQLVLAWLLAQGPDIIPIPGTKRIEILEENLKSVDVQLTPEDVARISASVPAEGVAGMRYPAPMMERVNL